MTPRNLMLELTEGINVLTLARPATWVIKVPDVQKWCYNYPP
jgi:hypothetical protein